MNIQKAVTLTANSQVNIEIDMPVLPDNFTVQAFLECADFVTPTLGSSLFVSGFFKSPSGKSIFVDVTNVDSVPHNVVIHVMAS